MRRVGERVGEGGKTDLLPLTSRDDGRCCQDRVPALLRVRGEVVAALGEDSISLPSSFDTSRSPFVPIDVSSRKGSDLAPVACSGVRGVGESCSGGSIPRRLREEMLNRAESNTGESFVGEIDRARSTQGRQRRRTRSAFDYLIIRRLGQSTERDRKQ